MDKLPCLQNKTRLQIRADTELINKTTNRYLSFEKGRKIMRKYMRKNIIPIIIEAAFIISCVIIPKEYFIYTNFIFYLLLLVYFHIKKDFSLTEWLSNIKGGKEFGK